MYLARFSYDVAPANRERALKSMRQELEAALQKVGNDSDTQVRRTARQALRAGQIGNGSTGQ